MASKQAEEAVIGSILLEPQVIEEVIRHVKPSDFYFQHTKKAFEAMLKIYSSGRQLDEVSLYEELAKEDEKFALDILKLAEIVPTAQHVEEYAKIVKEYSLKRRLREIANKLHAWLDQKEPVNAILGTLEKQIFKLADEHAPSRIYPAYEVVGEILGDILRYKEEYLLYGEISTITGIPYGFAKLDRMTSGIHEGEYVIIAARPSMGKTSFALTLALHMALASQTPVGIFSLEMEKKQLFQRLLSIHSGVPLQKIRTGSVDVKDEIELALSSYAVATAPIYIDDDPNLTPQLLRLKARKMVRDYGTQVIIIDYLQLMHHRRRSESRQQEIAEISRSLKLLAKELNISIIALSQLSRAVEQRENKRPRLSDLRESGAIEQDADTVIFIYRHEYYAKSDFLNQKHHAEVIIGKQRNGPLGTVYLVFEPSTTAFLEF